MEYLDSNLTTLNHNLLRANFERILEVIWLVVIEEMKVQATSGIGVSRLEGNAVERPLLSLFF